MNSDYLDYNQSKIDKVTANDSINKAKGIQQLSSMGAEALDRKLQERESFLKKIFPDPTKRAVVQGELALIQEEYKFRQEVLKMVKQTQVQALKETCNEYLIQGKAASRAETAKLLISKAQELESEINRIGDYYDKEIEEKYVKYSQIQHPGLRQKREKQLEESIDGFLKLQNEILQKFRNIVSEGV